MDFWTEEELNTDPPLELGTNTAMMALYFSRLAVEGALDGD